MYNGNTSLEWDLRESEFLRCSSDTGTTHTAFLYVLKSCLCLTLAGSPEREISPCVSFISPKTFPGHLLNISWLVKILTGGQEDRLPFSVPRNKLWERNHSQRHWRVSWLVGFVGFGLVMDMLTVAFLPIPGPRSLPPESWKWGHSYISDSALKKFSVSGSKWTAKCKRDNSAEGEGKQWAHFATSKKHPGMEIWKSGNWRLTLPVWG